MITFFYFVNALMAFIWGSSINMRDLPLHMYKSRLKNTTLVSIISVLLVAFYLSTQMIGQPFNFLVIVTIIISIVTSFVVLFLITKIGTKSLLTSLLLYLLTSVIIYQISLLYSNLSVAFLNVVILAFVFRNSMFGAPHRRQIRKLFNNVFFNLVLLVGLGIFYWFAPQIAEHEVIIFFLFILLKLIFVRKEKGIYFRRKLPETKSSESELYKDFAEARDAALLQDFSYAGTNYGVKHDDNPHLPIYNIADYGVEVNSKRDQTAIIQKVIDDVGKNGGGVIFFPSGEYHLLNEKDSKFIQINYSNIVIQGEMRGTDIGTVFISHRHTLVSEKNPWLSPFLFTCGEMLQASNLFWGVQFKKKKNIITRSASLADPGSDGSINEPVLTTQVTADSKRGSYYLKVDDTASLRGVKYVIIAMFNTSEDGNLIKDILGTEVLLDEWKTAKRAGEEVAPSFQWLVEIEKIVDENTLLLKQPLRRDILLEFDPALYEVEMLERIGFRDITIKSRWNGVFRHHGFPIYYTPKEAQVMDYGWNAVNFKRVAHGFMKNVHIENFSNPLYVQDSRNLTIEDVRVSGNDGHQGIKLYGHAADNLFRRIDFMSHYADMIGGEGNCYGNVFNEISYSNVDNHYVDFDFHGFSEGPFSPPAYNLFENCIGFRGIKGAGALYNLPACAAFNVWWNIESEGYDGSDSIFIMEAYRRRNQMKVFFGILKQVFVYAVQNRVFKVGVLATIYKEKTEEKRKLGVSRRDHSRFFKSSVLSGYFSRFYKLDVASDDVIVENLNHGFVEPYSLYNAQLQTRLKEN